MLHFRQKPLITCIAVSTSLIAPSKHAFALCFKDFYTIYHHNTFLLRHGFKMGLFKTKKPVSPLTSGFGAQKTSLSELDLSTSFSQAALLLNVIDQTFSSQKSCIELGSFQLQPHVRMIPSCRLRTRAVRVNQVLAE